MGLLGGLMGHASEIDAAKVQAEFERVLAPGERVERAYQLIRDQFVFTDKRLIPVDGQGMTARRWSTTRCRIARSRISASRPRARSTWTPS
jgi:hypothetical protein